MFTRSHKETDPARVSRLTLIRVCAALAALAIITVATAPQALAAAGEWHTYHTAGSTGVVDLSDQKKCRFKNGRVMIKGARETATAVIRYDLHHGVDGNISPSYVAIIPRYRDNGDDARVIIKLRTYDIMTGSTTTLMTFDSNAYPQDAGYQVANINVDDPPWQFQNSDAYWLEVTLEKTGEAGKPELGMIRFVWQEA